MLDTEGSVTGIAVNELDAVTLSTMTVSPEGRVFAANK